MSESISEINEIFQNYIAANADAITIDFTELLNKYPQHKEKLQKKISAYQKIVGTFNDESSPEPTFTPGRTIGGCTLLKVLGQGGMGVVYLARQEKLSRDVVIKVLRPFAIDNTALKERFIRESRIIGRLNHKNIVPVYDVGEDEGSFYILMKHVEGISLSTLIEKCGSKERTTESLNKVLAELFPNGHSIQVRTPTEFFCNLIIKVADAVQYAHDNGVIHRDIKPSNIILESDGNPILLDFGLSHDEIETNLTVSGEYLGTPVYSAPEVFTKNAETNNRQLDVYSLGVTFYELLTGGLPYEGTSIYEIYANIKNEEPIQVKKRWSHIPRDLEVIINTAIAKETAIRYTAANLLREDLQYFLEYKPIKAKKPSTIIRFFYLVKRKRTSVGFKVGILSFCLLLTLAYVYKLNNSLKYSKVGNVENVINSSNLATLNGNNKRALDILQNAQKLYPNNVDIMFALVDVLTRLNKYDEALQITNGYLSRNAPNDVALDNKASLLEMTGKIQEAIELEKDLVKNNPTIFSHYYWLVIYLGRAGMYDEMLHYAEKAFGIQKDIDLYAFIAKTCDQINKYDCANRYYEILLSYAPKLSSETYQENYLVDATEFYKKNGGIVKLIKPLNDFLENNPNNKITREILTLILLQQKKYDAALEEAKIGIRINPKDGTAWKSLALCYFHKKDYKNAIDAQRQAIALGFDEPAASILIAKAYALDGNFQESKTMLDEFLLPNNFDILSKVDQGEVYGTLGYVYLNIGRQQEAVTYLERAIEFGYTSEIVFMQLADAYIANGKYGMAEEILLQLLAADKYNLNAREILLKLYADANKKTQYKEFYEKQRLIGGEPFLDEVNMLHFTPPFRWEQDTADLKNVTYQPPQDDILTQQLTEVGINISENISNIEQLFELQKKYSKELLKGEVLDINLLSSAEKPGYIVYLADLELLISGRKFIVKEKIILKNNKAYVLCGLCPREKYQEYAVDFKVALDSFGFINSEDGTN